MDRRTLIALAGAVPLIPAMPALAQDDRERRLRQDWAWLGRYADDNAKLLAAGTRPGIVFLGDSITEGWRRIDPGMFRPGRVCRGIGGQTTPQMLVRMVPDVIALRPRFVHIMAGTNDVAGNTGPMTVEQTCANLRTMAQLARANGIGVILASVPPADHFGWRPDVRPLESIRAINRWIAGYARRERLTHIDYGPALAAPGGGMRSDLGPDGVHPNAAGYAAMDGVLEPVLKARRV